MGGIYTLWGAVVAGALIKLLPALLDNWGLPADLLTILFGVGMLQVLLTAPQGVAAQFPRDMAAPRGRDRRGCSNAASPPARPRSDRGRGPDRPLRRRDADRRHDHQVPGGTCGLIGPNGAGKTTFFNVLSGFVRPAAGNVHADGEDLLAMADYRRARWGLRRTFQTEQAIEELSVYDNVAMVHEHSKLGRADRATTFSPPSTFVGLDLDPYVKVGGLGARERRLVEVARAVVGKPRLVLLDEPAAGLPTRRPSTSAASSARSPRSSGALVILVDHDMSLVSACCELTAVLDFGKLIASGPTRRGAARRAGHPGLPGDRGCGRVQRGRGHCSSPPAHEKAAPCCGSTRSASRAAGAPSCARSRSRSRRARSPRCWGPTAPASRRSCSRWPASCAPGGRC